MLNLAGALAIAGRDPLIPLLGALVLGGTASLLLFRQHPVRRAIVRVVFLVVLTVAFLHTGIVPYQPMQWTGSPFEDLAHSILKIAWWLWAAWFVVGFLRAFVIVERRPRESKLLQDLLAGFMYVTAVFAIIAYVFDLPVKGLLVTSGAVAIILGLALQSTLGDVFSGVVLGFSRPYLPGDWVKIDGTTEGRVIEMNWRATHMLTERRDLAIVPNSTIAKSKIVNVSAPSRTHGVTITIQVVPDTPPSSAIEILDNAALNCLLILATPPPTIAIHAITASFTEFEITFFVGHLSSSTSAQNQLYDMIFRHLAMAGIGLALPDSQPEAAGQMVKRPPEEILLDLVDIFRPMAAADRCALAAKLKPAAFGEGETLVRPGDLLKSLFIIGTGVASISRRHAGSDVELERLGPADHYGEIGMLTGGAAIATIRALTPVIIYEISKADLAPILKSRPQVAHELSRALARRQAAGGSTESAALTADANGLGAWFSERLHRFADLAHDG